ncbi:MAG TPA: fibrillarin-like rRNA/tRNA 2'-O-methyltransferase [Thermoplasmatales archaeon]|nr:fibrillarin-like rRNA/tRNA 2'-O-methyltransferase [Thermoplasmatales archaeon]
MGEPTIEGVIKEGNRLFTITTTPQPRSVYGEKIIHKKNKTLRAWNPYRSKLAAAILKKTQITFSKNNKILYLGAATGTTVSHLSDILTQGTVYAVEKSPFAMQKLLELSNQRNNIIPILSDADHPEKYQHIVPTVDIVYQDISQRNQLEIFIKNIENYLKKDGQGIMMIKARSINVTMDPNQVYQNMKQKIREQGYKITDYKKLDPYAKDHAVMVVTR